MKRLFGTVIFLAVFASHAAGDDGQWFTFGDEVRSLHVPSGSQRIWITPAFEDYAHMLFDACDAMKLSAEDCLIYPMNGDLGGNAIATVLDGNRVIIYDRTLHGSTSFDPATVIAHELGHHFCGHLDEAPTADQELESDRFAGAAMRLEGTDLAALIKSADSLDSRPSVMHPGKTARIRALTEGWENPSSAKHCRD